MSAGKQNDWTDDCRKVLDAVFDERVRQEAQYTENEALLDGTGPSSQWLLPYTTATATAVEAALRVEYELTPGLPTWAFLVREEIAEAFMEPAGSKQLEEELIQVAALCASWVERLRRRK